MMQEKARFQGGPEDGKILAVEDIGRKSTLAVIESMLVEGALEFRTSFYYRQELICPFGNRYFEYWHEDKFRECPIVT